MPRHSWHFVAASALAAGLCLAPATLAAQSARLQLPDSTAADSTAAPATRRDDAFARRERERLRRRAAFDGSVRGRPPGDPQAPQPVPLPAGGFRVTVRTDSPEYVADETDGDPMYIQVISSADGYLTLVSGGTGPELTILAPNGLIAQLPVRAGVPLAFPFPDWTRQGVELRAQLPEGLDESQQAIFAVVTRRPVALPPYDYETGQPPSAPNTVSLRTFQAWLAALPQRQRGIGQVFYLVRRP
jgi:hypothetical protein